MFFSLDATNQLTKYHDMHNNYSKEMEIIEFDGQDWQITSVQNVTQPGGVGEDEIMYVAMNRHGQLKDIMDWELAEYNLSQMGMA